MEANSNNLHSQIKEYLQKDKIRLFIQKNRTDYGLMTSIAMIICIFLPWSKISSTTQIVFSTSRSIHYHWGISSSIGFIALIIACAAIYLYQKKHNWTVFAGLAEIILGIYRMLNSSGNYFSQSPITDYGGTATNIKAAFGLYLFLIMAIIFTLIASKFNKLTGNNIT